MKNLVSTYWLHGVLGLQFILLIGMFWYVQNRLSFHETVLNNQGGVITQIVQFIQQAQTPKQ